jgi:hypothetical protein
VALGIPSHIQMIVMEVVDRKELKSEKRVVVVNLNNAMKRAPMEGVGVKVCKMQDARCKSSGSSAWALLRCAGACRCE